MRNCGLEDFADSADLQVTANARIRKIRIILTPHISQHPQDCRRNSPPGHANRPSTTRLRTPPRRAPARHPCAVLRRQASLPNVPTGHIGSWRGGYPPRPPAGHARSCPAKAEVPLMRLESLAKAASWAGPVFPSKCLRWQAGRGLFPLSLLSVPHKLTEHDSSGDNYR